MAFLVLLCVYVGSFLSRGSFSGLAPAPAYAWALFGRRTCQGRMRAEGFITGERLKNRSERCDPSFVLLHYRGVGEGSSSKLASVSACVCRKEGSPHPWVKPLILSKGPVQV